MLVDGNALVHRGFHALPGLTTKHGEPTGAVYGFAMILLRAMKDIKPTHVACTFDLAAPTFRHERYKDYKATRVKAPQELYDQIPKVKEVVRALGIPIFEREGYEADDVLGTLAARLCEQNGHGCEVLIVTGDLDCLQLVNRCVKVYTMRKGLSDTVVYDERAVRERYGFLPSQVVDYKALRGDPSDNIKGVSGIGEKTAAELIVKFKSLDGLYAAVAKGGKKAEGIKPKVLALLTEQKAQAYESYALSKIETNVPLDVVVPPYDFDAPHARQTVELFKELEFRSLVAKLPKTEVAAGAEPVAVAAVTRAPEKKFTQRYQLVQTHEALAAAVGELARAKEVAVDTETTGLSVQDAALVGVGLCGTLGEAYYVPAALALSSPALRDLLKDPALPKVGHNLKFDLAVLEAAGLNLGPLSFDTMVASYLLNAGSRQHNLDTLAFNELGYQMQPIEDLIGSGKAQISMDQVEPEKVSWYCCEDVDMTLRLKEVFDPQLKEQGLSRIFTDIELPLVPVLAAVERAGILLDVKLINELSGEAEVQIKGLERDIYALSGTEFNINSPKQLKEILFERLGLVPVENRRTKTGLSTAAGELEKMLGQHPVIQKLLEYRELAKLQSTYLLALPKLVNRRTGRIHTSYNQTVAATGRLSSTDPNLQNIPVRGEGLGSRIRQAFVAKPGYRLLSLDYSQIELRIVAHLAQDEKMLAVFKNREDIHTKTASEIFGVPENRVTKDMRRDAKTINFGILYGVSSFGLSSRIQEMSRAEAKQFIERYFAAYPKVEAYVEQIKLQVREEGFVRNELGRIRRFPEAQSSQYPVRAAAERAAVNFPIQSLAADVMKVAMVNAYRETSGKAEDIQMLLQVHDELVFEVREDLVEAYAKRLIPVMENALTLSVPVEVEAKAGPNWGEMEVLTLT